MGRISHEPFYGEIFGRWMIMDETPVKKDGQGSRFFHVECICGNRGILSIGSLVHEKSTMCHSCAVKEKSKPRLDARTVLINAVLLDYKKSANRRTLHYELTTEQFEKMIFSDCFYCGRAPSNLLKDRNGDRELPKYNGIDRMNNLIGYLPDNVVPCCRWCNEAKRAKSTEEFIQWISGLSKNLEKISDHYLGDWAQARKN